VAARVDLDIGADRVVPIAVMCDVDRGHEGKMRALDYARLGLLICGEMDESTTNILFASFAGARRAA